MIFKQAYELLMQGKKIRRRGWADHRIDFWVEVVEIPPLPDGRQFVVPLPLVWMEKGFLPWTGAANDILFDDWEEVP